MLYQTVFIYYHKLIRKFQFLKALDNGGGGRDLFFIAVWDNKLGGVHVYYSFFRGGDAFLFLKLYFYCCSCSC